jgi:flagellin
MASVINTNLASLYAQRNLSGAQSSLSTAVERLSSGLRINRAKDDAAGLGISENIKQQITAINQGVRNANDAISMVQTAEGSLSEVSTILQRMKELSVQARNDSLSTVQRTYISDELVALKNEINAIAERTTFNDISLAKNGLRTMVSTSAVGANQLKNGASVLSGLTVSDLVAKNVNAGTYTLSSSTQTALSNQQSTASQKFGGSEVDTITLGGKWVIGDTIESNVTIDGQTTVSATYTVTTQDVASGATVSTSDGNDLGTRNSVAAGMAYQLNKAAAAAGQALAFSARDGVVYVGTDSGDTAITTTATVTSSDVNTKAVATVGQGTLANASRQIDINSLDAVEGNKFVLTINGRDFSVVATSGASASAIRDQVANDLTELLVASYPGSGRVNQVDNVSTDDTGAITLASSLGLGTADISLSVYRLVDGADVANQASTVSDPSSTSAAVARTITLNDFDVMVGRKATVTIGDPTAYTTFSTVMGLDDTATTVADRLATLINNTHGNTSDSAGVITIAAAANFGMYDISMSFNDMENGAQLSARSSVSAKNLANVARKVTINQNDLTVGNVVSVSVNGTEYATKVASSDTADTVAARLVSQLDNVYGRTAGTVTQPTVAETTAGTQNSSTGAYEYADVTFADIRAGETIILAGVTMTALADMTASQVATAWSGKATGATIADTSLADFSVSSLTGYATTSQSATTVRYTFATSLGNVSDLSNTGTAKLSSLVVTDGQATAVTTPAYESQTVTFGSAGMSAGDSVTIAGLTFTATRNITQAEVAAAFDGLANGAESGDGADYGTYSGALSGWASGTATATGVAFTASSYGNKTDQALNIKTQRIDSGVSASASAVTFSGIATSGTQSLTFGNLKLTVVGATMTAAEVASQFASLVNGQDVPTSPGSGVTWSYANTAYTAYTGGYTTGIADGDTVTFYSENPLDSALAASDFTASTGVTAPTVATTSSNVIQFGQGTGLGLADISVSVKSISNAGQFTLTANDDTGIGGTSQTVDMGTVSAGGTKTMVFDKLGVTFTLNNARDTSVGSSDFEVFSSAVDTLTIDSGSSGNALFQVGSSTRDVVSIDGFKDIRVTGHNKNSGTEKDVFDRLNTTLNLIAQNTTESLSSANFATLETQIEDVITTVSDFRSYFGAQQNRIEFAISNLQAQAENLTAANSRIRDTDYAAETANLTKTQIMQQAATAMLAQANQMPNVILALLK